MVLQEYHNMCQDRRYQIRTAVKLKNRHNKGVVGGDNILVENIEFHKGYNFTIHLETVNWKFE